MRTLAHLSDVHFGREDPALVERLLESVAAARPDVVVVSGDFTQRAKKRQFRAARAFLKRLPKVPQLLVPGNHDVSATNLVERVVRPLLRYRKYIADDLSPFYEDGEVAIAGINTVRMLSTKDGRVNAAQVALACKQLGTAATGAIRVVVTHHPLDVPADDDKHPVVTRAAAAMKAFAACGVDLFLSGHLHGGLSFTTASRYPIAGYAGVVAHAGTAISTRTRLDPNGWNLIELVSDSMRIRKMSWDEEGFVESRVDGYRRTGAGWVPAAGSGANGL